MPFITVSMWSFHDRLFLSVTPSILAVEQDLIIESWYVISVLDCKIWRFRLELINISFDWSVFMDMWLRWHHLSTCNTSLVSEVITTSKELLCVDRVVSSAKISAHEYGRITAKSKCRSKLVSDLEQSPEAHRLRLAWGQIVPQK